jgi:hypothetical protein
MEEHAACDFDRFVENLSAKTSIGRLHGRPTQEQTLAYSPSLTTFPGSTVCVDLRIAIFYFLNRTLAILVPSSPRAERLCRFCSGLLVFSVPLRIALASGPAAA